VVAILKLQLHIRNPTLSVDVYLLEQSFQFLSQSDMK